MAASVVARTDGTNSHRPHREQWPQLLSTFLLTSPWPRLHNAIYKVRVGFRLTPQRSRNVSLAVFSGLFGRCFAVRHGLDASTSPRLDYCGCRKSERETKPLPRTEKPLFLSGRRCSTRCTRILPVIRTPPAGCGREIFMRTVALTGGQVAETI
jgi:hypothetical protein